MQSKVWRKGTRQKDSTTRSVKRRSQKDTGEIMSKTQHYTQCKLARYPLKGGVESTRLVISEMSWIPSEFAKKNKVLRIKQPDGTWQDGWVVSEIYTTRTADDIESCERDYMKQRAFSDV